MRTDRERCPWRMFIKIMKYLLMYYKLSVLAVMLLMTVSSAAGIAVPLVLHILIDDYLLPFIGTDGGTPFTVVRVIAVMAAIYYAGLLCSYLYNRMMVVITRGTTRNIRVELFSHLERLPIHYFDTHSHGDMMSVFTNDTDTLRQMISQSIPQLISSGVILGGTLTAMLILNPALAVITVVMTAAMFILVRYLTKKNASYFSDRQEDMGKLNGYIEEMMGGQKTIALFSMEHKNLSDFELLNRRLKESSYRSVVYGNILYPVMTDISYAAYIITAVAGGFMIYRGYPGMTVGILAAFLQMCRMFIQPVSQISQQINYIITAIAGVGRMFGLLDEEVEEDSGKTGLIRGRDGQWLWEAPGEEGLRELRGDIRFSDVSFGYGKNREVLKKLTFFVKSGDMTAFVGPTGAGKTSVINLINRFYDPLSGAIQIDGFNLSEIKKSDIRKIIGVVTQETWLFSGTIRENIGYGLDDIREEEIVQAAKQAQAHRFIMELPDGYETRLTNNGENLSEGQRQLLAIARTIAANPAVLLFDEATAYLDTRTEKLVQQGIRNLMQGRTILIIAHRLATVRSADHIIVFQDGRIAEEGTHEELLKKHGLYGRMCRERG